MGVCAGRDSQLSRLFSVEDNSSFKIILETETMKYLPVVVAFVLIAFAATGPLSAHCQIPCIPLPIVHTLLILATKLRKIIHHSSSERIKPTSLNYYAQPSRVYEKQPHVSTITEHEGKPHE